MIVPSSPLASVLPAVRCLAGGMSCLLAIAAPTLAQTLQPNMTDADNSVLISSRAYSPPPGAQGSGGGASTGGGVRGCGGEMLALAPAFNSSGQTFSERPTFVWYLGEMPTNRLNFTLFHQGEAGETAVFSQELTATTGYQAFTLPTEAAPLQLGETYRWATTLYCEETADNAIRWIEAAITVVEPPASLPLLDTVAPMPWQKGLRFARAGYWYDALAQVYAGETADERALRQALLLDLADLAATADTDMSNRWSDRLRTVVETP
ncbi:MAG: DUF928 domain-containing protein [Cyanobacteria bacterium P01_D01_bin.6]